MTSVRGQLFEQFLKAPPLIQALFVLGLAICVATAFIQWPQWFVVSMLAVYAMCFHWEKKLLKKPKLSVVEVGNVRIGDSVEVK
jgi:hypothetical protein